MPKLKLLILDAGVVIKLHEWNLWKQVIAKCEVRLSSIVANSESEYHQVDGDDWDQDIDLSQDIQDGKIIVFEVPLADILAKNLPALNFSAYYLHGGGLGRQKNFGQKDGSDAFLGTKMRLRRRVS